MKYRGVICALGIAGGVLFGCLDMNCLTVGDIPVVDFSQYNITEAQTQIKSHSKIDRYSRTLRFGNIEKLNSGVVYGEKIVRSVSVPKVEGCRSYNITFMPYTKVTDKNSRQYVFLNGVGCYTDEDTGLRMYSGRYCVAVGTGFASEIGTKLNVHMKNGAVIRCILGDVKSDFNTDSLNLYHNEDGSVLEMIVDDKIFMSSRDYPPELSGSILSIDIIGD